MERIELIRQKRLNQVFEHLKRYHGIYTKDAFAAAVEHGRTSMSAALNGNPEYLSAALMRKIVKHYPGVFNLQCLLTGEGDLLTPEEQQRITNQTTTPADPLELYASMIRGLDDIRVELKGELESIRAVKSELQQSRDDFREATQRLTQALNRLDDSRPISSYIAADSDF